MEQEQESKRDISSEWMKGILESLKRLEFHERNIRNGCQSLHEYIAHFQFQNAEVILQQTQIQNIDMMLNEFEIVLENIKDVISTKQMEEVRAILNDVKVLKFGGTREMIEKNEGNPVPLFEPSFDRRQTPSRLTGYTFKRGFHQVSAKLSFARGKLVSYLNHILFIPKDKATTTGKVR